MARSMARRIVYLLFGEPISPPKSRKEEWNLIAITTIILVATIIVSIVIVALV